MKNEIEFNPDAFKVLQERGFIHTMSHEAELKKALESGRVVFYLGIDPTADNLHVGHFFGLQVFRILQNHGHKGVLLIGNATAMIGDPSFKNDMRKMLSRKEINRNAKKINTLLPRFIDVKSADIVHNANWFKKQKFVQFMHDVGVHFNVSEMLSKDCYKNRLGSGLTFLEMSYMLMQAYDFIHLNNKFGCTLQIGGSDQWSNILAGVELGRKMALVKGKDRSLMMAFCNPLLLNSNGTKMGKTEKGTLWVSGNKRDNVPYDCFQHFINVADADVERLLTFFTTMPVEDIKSLCKNDIVSAKKIMAYEVTKKIHGEIAACKARDTSTQLFNKDKSDDTGANAPHETIQVPADATIADVLANTSIISSKREAKELIASGAILVDGEKITDPTMPIDKKEMLIKKGKKTFLSVKITNK